MAQAIDLTGQKFGLLTVVKRDFSKKGAAYWFCQCECGSQIENSIKASNLKSGNTKSCGCLRGQNLKEKAVNLLGQRFGSLIATQQIKNNKNQLGWLCKCDCGENKWYPTSFLTSGKATSCGCHLTRDKKKIIDITGKRYGKLIVIEPDLTQDGYCICKCDCGNILSVRKTNLRTGNTSSCGCLKSKGEQKISAILKELHISFSREVTFPELLGKEKQLKFDFYLPQKNILIEYQGQQHYKSVDFFGGEEIFQKQKEYDTLKRIFCEKNNFKLIEIPYWDFDKINNQYINDLIMEKE